MVNYGQAKIYKLVNDVDDKIYVGSTCNPLHKRKQAHKATAKKISNRTVYQHLNAIGWDNVRIVLIEALECKNKDEVRAREQHHIDLLKPELNTFSAIDDCPHGKRKNQCVECHGAGICIHNKQKHQCKICGGSQICIHSKRKQNCKECGGSSICIHNKRKQDCKDCGGSSICIHNKRKQNCKECGGSSICIHNKRKQDCKDCGGSSICIHNKRKQNCKICNGDKHWCYLCSKSFSGNRFLKTHEKLHTINDYLTFILT
jgi:hypothetical protein